MSCSCFAALLNALKPPWVQLPPIAIPPCVLQMTPLSGLAGASIMASASATAQLSAAVSLNLPALPISVTLLGRISAAASIVAQVKAQLGIDLFGPDATLRLSAIFADFNAFPFAALEVPAVGALGPLLSMAGLIKSSLGVDLFAPGAAVSLQAAASAMVSASASFSAAIPLPKLSLIASYSAVASAAAALGVGANIGAMAGRLQMLASLKLPALNFNPMLLARLLNFLAARAAAAKAFGFDPFGIGASVKLGLALAPLDLLASVKLSENIAAAAKVGAAAAASASLNADFAAMASVSASLSALATIKLPNLAPSMMLAAVVGQARNSSACSPDCPVKM